jgi:hypothetical protein
MLPHEGVQTVRTPVGGPSANAPGAADAGTAAVAGAPAPATAKTVATTALPREILTRFIRPSYPRQLVFLVIALTAKAAVSMWFETHTSINYLPVIRG